MEKPKKKFVITDLDNTVYDWFEFWYQSFSAMLSEIVKISEIPEDQIIKEIKSIHEKYGTSEFAFLIEEIPSLKSKFTDQDLKTVFDPAIHAYRSKRKKYLKLYPEVFISLKKLKENGCKIVAYSESMQFYSMYRIKTLELDGLIDVLYTPADHEHPEKISLEDERSLSQDRYRLNFTDHKFTPAGARKPNPEILEDILHENGFSKELCIYVGDSLMKDIQMAQEVGITDVHAEYGERHRSEQYELLRRVTHWTQEDVEKEKQLKKNEVNPTFSLKNGFYEIFDYFDFEGEVDGGRLRGSRSH